MSIVCTGAIAYLLRLPVWLIVITALFCWPVLYIVAFAVLYIAGIQLTAIPAKPQGQLKLPRQRHIRDGDLKLNLRDKPKD